MISAFSPTLRVTPESAMIDRLKLQVSLGCLSGPSADVDRVIRRMGDSKLFCKPQRFGKINVRKKPLHPLFSGTVSLGYVAGRETQCSNVMFYLDTNLPRLARHQNIPLDNSDPLLVKKEGAHSFTSETEFALDSSDNWIPSGDYFDYFTPDTLDKLLVDSLKGIEGLVSSEIQKFYPDSSPQYFPKTSSRCLNEVEVYFEFQHPASAQLVRDIASRLKDFAKGSEKTEYFEGVVETTGENLQSWKYTLRKGQTLKIYPKLNNRIRVELTYNLKKNSSPLGKRTGESLEEVSSLLSQLKSDAAESVNRMLNHLESQGCPELYSLNQAGLIARIAATLGNETHAIAFLEMLRAGGIDRKRLSPVLVKSFNKLKRKSIGILKRNEQNKLHYLFPEGRHALEMLRNSSDSLMGAIPAPAPLPEPPSLPGKIIDLSRTIKSVNQRNRKGKNSRLKKEKSLSS